MRLICITGTHGARPTFLYDASGQAIYLFDAGDSDRPQCYGDCAEAWPPVLTKGSPRATGAVRSSLLGTNPRRKREPVRPQADAGRFEQVGLPRHALDAWFARHPA